MITLGINYTQMHDSSAAVVRDGDLLFAVAEERLSRIKHDARFPHLAIKACMDFARIRSDQIDELCFGWSPPRRGFLHDLRTYAQGQRAVNYLNVVNTTRHFLSMWHQHGGANRFRYHFGLTKARVRFVDHHLAHAISAYAYSGFDDATVVVMDGRGAWEATSVWRGHDGRLDHVWTIPWPNSLGLFYAEFTEYLGFQKYSDEWKVMGLAPYGGPGVDLREFIVPDDAPYWVNMRCLSEGAPKIAQVLGPSRVPESEIYNRHKDVAWAVQDACEQAMLTVVAMAVEKTRCRNACLAGGVALNSKANGKILASGLVDRLFIQPASADDGVALGAALAPHLDAGGRLPMKRMRHVYLGPESGDAEIENSLRTYKLRYTRLDNPAKTTADLLVEGKIVGWFQGRMEFGPRALGSRSILADPRHSEMNIKVNNAVKFREWWRPFAPSLLAEAAQEYLEHAADSPFMILTFPVRPAKRSVIPAVTHVDGTARPQTVEEEINPLYRKLLCAFRQSTGVPVILNTSFNLRGEPIVCSPTDAIRTFFSSGMDALVIGPFLVEK